MYDYTAAYDAASRAMLALKDFEGKSKLSTWFYRVALNETLREHKRLLTKRDRERSVHAPDDDTGEAEAQELEDPRKDADPAERLDLEYGRRALPSEQEQVLRLREEGYKIREIARKLGLPPGTVASRLRLARAKLGRKTRRPRL